MNKAAEITTKAVVAVASTAISWYGTPEHRVVSDANDLVTSIEISQSESSSSSPSSNSAKDD